METETTRLKIQNKKSKRCLFDRLAVLPFPFVKIRRLPCLLVAHASCRAMPCFSSLLNEETISRSRAGTETDRTSMRPDQNRQIPFQHRPLWSDLKRTKDPERTPNPNYTLPSLCTKPSNVTFNCQSHCHCNPLAFIQRRPRTCQKNQVALLPLPFA